MGCRFLPHLGSQRKTSDRRPWGLGSVDSSMNWDRHRAYTISENHRSECFTSLAICVQKFLRSRVWALGRCRGGWDEKAGETAGRLLGSGFLCRGVKCVGRRPAATGRGDLADRMSAGDRIQYEPAPDACFWDWFPGGLLQIWLYVRPTNGWRHGSAWGILPPCASWWAGPEKIQRSRKSSRNMIRCLNPRTDHVPLKLILKQRALVMLSSLACLKQLK
jgi:hypothetical protein